MNRFVLIAALALATSHSAPAMAQADAASIEDRTALLAAQGEKWRDILLSGDWAALRELYAHDAVLMTQGQAKIEGADAIVAFLQRVPKAGGSVDFTFENEEVIAKHGLGFVTARYLMTVTFPGREPILAAGRSFLVYKWDGTGWKLWRDIDNLAPDATAQDFAN